MTISFVQHRVADYDAWRRAYDGVGELQRAGGVTDDAVYRTEGDPNTVLVMHKFGSPQEAQAFFENSDLRQAMQDAGVDTSSIRLEFYEEA
jgi:hypothetical protein